MKMQDINRHYVSGHSSWNEYKSDARVFNWVAVSEHFVFRVGFTFGEGHKMYLDESR